MIEESQVNVSCLQSHQGTGGCYIRRDMILCEKARGTRQPLRRGVVGVCLAASMALSPVALADFELAAPDGRRIQLKDDGTWRYLEATNNDRADDRPGQQGEAVLTLERRIERGTNCRFELRLVNNLPYEIRSLVPYYSAYRADGVLYDTVASGASFAAMRPGDALRREIEFVGIPCREIVRVQVVGGDRCNMGDLDKFTDSKGQCLARVRVVASDLVRFDK